MDTEQKNTGFPDQDSWRIGFGGNCHWCAEAIFLSVKGVISVLQGWIASQESPAQFSEAVIVNFNPSAISLKQLISIHLHTHSCTSRHSMRDKYRSAVYVFNDEQFKLSTSILQDLQQDFNDPIITEILDFGAFKMNKPEYLNYYFSGTEKPFCQNIVNPKLRLLLTKFKAETNEQLLGHLLAK